MYYEHAYSGSALSSAFGLVLSGSLYDASSYVKVENTLDGMNFEPNTLPDLPDEGKKAYHFTLLQLLKLCILQTPTQFPPAWLRLTAPLCPWAA